MGNKKWMFSQAAKHWISFSHRVMESDRIRKWSTLCKDTYRLLFLFYFCLYLCVLWKNELTLQLRLQCDLLMLTVLVKLHRQAVLTFVLTPADLHTWTIYGNLTPVPNTPNPIFAHDPVNPGLCDSAVLGKHAASNGQSSKSSEE